MSATATASNGSTNTAPGGIFGLPCVSQVLDFFSEFRIDQVNELLLEASYVSLFAAGSFVPGQTVTVPARRMTVGTALADGGLWGLDAVGEPLAALTFAWQPIPQSWVAHQDVQPPATAFEPRRGQRVQISTFELAFPDGSKLTAFGTGRTFPGAGGTLRLGAALDVEKTAGAFKHLCGAISISAEIAAPDQLTMAIMVRMMDPREELNTTSVPPIAHPEPPPPGLGTTMTFLGETDPKHPVTLRTSSSGALLGSNVYENLRPAIFQAADMPGPRAHTMVGPIVGSVKAVLAFDPLKLCPIGPVQTRKGIFRFHTPDGKAIGELSADMTEGRAIRTFIAGALLPVFRFVGAGPMLGGTGEFAGASGLMTMNSAISVFPRTLSNCYILRFDDPDGRLRRALGSFVLS